MTGTLACLVPGCLLRVVEDVYVWNGGRLFFVREGTVLVVVSAHHDEQDCRRVVHFVALESSAGALVNSNFTHKQFETYVEDLT